MELIIMLAIADPYDDKGERRTCQFCGAPLSISLQEPPPMLVVECAGIPIQVVIPFCRYDHLIDWQEHVNLNEVFRIQWERCLEKDDIRTLPIGWTFSEVMRGSPRMAIH